MNPLLLAIGAVFAFAALRKRGASVPRNAAPAATPTDAPVRRAPMLRSPNALRKNADPGREVLRLTNVLRARGGSCGGVAMGPVGALQWSDQLAASALAHAKDMATNGYFSHVSPSGSRPEERMAAAGWTLRPIGENIAAGQADPSEVMQGWIDSPGHCKNLLNGGYKHMGVAYFYAPNTGYKHFWVQNFGG